MGHRQSVASPLVLSTAATLLLHQHDVIRLRCLDGEGADLRTVGARLGLTHQGVRRRKKQSAATLRREFLAAGIVA